MPSLWCRHLSLTNGKAVLHVIQNEQRCAVKVNNVLVPNLEAINLSMSDHGTIATLVLSVDEVHLQGELDRILAGRPPGGMVQEKH